MQPNSEAQPSPRPLHVLGTTVPLREQARAQAASPAIREHTLTPGEARDRLYLEHPIVIDGVFFATKPVRAAYEQLATCITHRDSSRCFVAAPRCGKTHAIEVLRGALGQVFPNLVIISINAKGHDANTEKALFGDMLDDVGLRFDERTTAFTRRQRFKQHIKTRCSQLDSSIVLLFIDEAQSWHEDEFTFLRDLANDLKKFDSITLIAALFAQSKIVLTRSRLNAADRADLVGRYLRDPISLPGIQTLSDLEDVLRRCDDASLHEYPDYSGVPYSEFFLPRAFASGWRLVWEAPMLWRHLIEQVGASANQTVSIGMAWIISAIRDFLFQGTQVDTEDFVASDAMWEAAVKCGRYSSLTNTI